MGYPLRASFEKSKDAFEKSKEGGPLILLKVFELFAGIGAPRKALELLGIPHEVVGISEIDCYASRSYEAIYDEEFINYGDITKIKTDTLPAFDLLTWGFPCQDISAAGKLKGIVKGETRSGLYYEGLRILEAKRPTYSLIENVKNLTSKRFKDSFDQILVDLESLGYNNYWKVLNAKDYGVPQNRERVFIVSILRESDPFKGEFPWPEPFDNHLSVADFIEEEVADRFYISDDRAIELINRVKGGKKGQIPGSKSVQVSNALGSREHRSYGFRRVAPTLLARDYKDPIVVSILDDTKGYTNEVGVYAKYTPTLRASRYGLKVAIGTLRGRDKDNPSDRTAGILNEQGLETKKDGRSNTLTSVTKDNVLIESRDRELTAHVKIRKLTPREYWRLMGFGDEDFERAE